ncbi:MAG: 30S ribosomal protein S16 [Endomicrobia bacterium]|nr:30S ribosomal protein S16 [Endomicrobiia bacterium]MCX7940772.1 30S ribosomal protein S16 [Endomicrobiia bacterium]MDW8055600.1 30S ribosomal protein S16 [Elusimicrobiota bacterium]
MALRIRLQRVGKKNRPIFRVVVIEKSRAVSGKPVDTIGDYDPIKHKISLDVQKYEQWLKSGAVPSDTVRGLYKKILKSKKIQDEIISAISSTS